MHTEIPHSSIHWTTPSTLLRGTSISLIEDSILQHMMRGDIAYSGWRDLPAHAYPDLNLTFATPYPEIAVPYAESCSEAYQRGRGYFCEQLMHHPVIMEINIRPQTKIYSMRGHDGVVVAGKIPLEDITFMFAPGIDRLDDMFTGKRAAFAYAMRKASKPIRDARQRLIEGDQRLLDEANMSLAKGSRFTVTDYIRSLDAIYS